MAIGGSPLPPKEEEKNSHPQGPQGWPKPPPGQTGFQKVFFHVFNSFFFFLNGACGHVAIFFFFDK
jgi:hypothetical protein